MKKIIVISMLFTIALSGTAQTPEGNYVFRRQEMVAMFSFKPGNAFEFFYSYGAVDRTATGTFTVSGDTIKLKSDKLPGKDFAIVSQSKKGKQYRIRVVDANPYLVNHVEAIVFSGGEKKYFESGDDGIIEIKQQQCDSIFVRHELFPDIPTPVKDSKNSNTFFELKLNPSLAAVSFKGIDLFINNSELTCYPNYFMPIENMRFVKE